MKVAIAGYGQEGEASVAYWQSQGADVTVFDEREPTRLVPKGIPLVVGEGVFTRMQGFDLVIRTAGLNPHKIKTDEKVWSATNEFFAKCPVDIIGVTGTKGKGTTCSLITEILKAAGKTVHLVGNIGVPALEVLSSIENEDIVVFELSSFQLWDLERSPQTAVVLMIEPDHMDVHTSFEQYIDAKANIARSQDEDNLIVYHPENRFSAQIAGLSPARKKQYMKPSGAYVVDGQIVIGDVAVAKIEEISLVGGHNIENVCAAVTAAWEYTKNVGAVQYAIKDFKGLPHRLEFVRELAGVRYYNDSYSSAPGATIAAVRAFAQPEVLICGGFDRGLDYSELAQAISVQSNVKKIFLIGQTRGKIATALDQVNFSKYEALDDESLQEIVMKAESTAAAGDVVVLSPGCASFDMFRNFQDRGEQFKTIVKGLSQ